MGQVGLHFRMGKGVKGSNEQGEMMTTRAAALHVGPNRAVHERLFHRRIIYCLRSLVSLVRDSGSRNAG